LLDLRGAKIGKKRGIGDLGMGIRDNRLDNPPPKGEFYPPKTRYYPHKSKNHKPKLKNRKQGAENCAHYPINCAHKLII